MCAVRVISFILDRRRSSIEGQNVL